MYSSLSTATILLSHQPPLEFSHHLPAGLVLLKPGDSSNLNGPLIFRTGHPRKPFASQFLLPTAPRLLPGSGSSNWCPGVLPRPKFILSPILKSQAIMGRQFGSRQPSPLCGMGLRLFLPRSSTLPFRIPPPFPAGANVALCTPISRLLA